MTNGYADPASAREQLSALVDGELTAPSAVGTACSAWKEDAELRAAWHGYQLIGDVLRSEDLASLPARDSAFMQSLRLRLAAEPVVLAPAALDQPPALPTGNASTTGNRRLGRWAVPGAVAAGFMAVAGVLLVTRAPLQATAVDRVADAGTRSAPPAAIERSMPADRASPAVQPEAPVVADASRPGPQTVRTARLLRDPQLDRYLVAHKQFAGSTALGMPSGFLRNASAEVPGR